jgi:acyl-CoA reductase-like NAD-dependent aldehyde dehydrogenase
MTTTTMLNVEALRKPMEATHLSGINYTYAWRVSQLKALKKMIQNHKQEWTSAVYADLCKERTETEMVELLTITAEIDYILKHLKKWMAPEQVAGPYYQIVGFSEVQRKPLAAPGVLVIAPFNYPIQLALVPVIGSLAGGNPTVLKPSELTPTVSALMAKLIPQYLELGAVQGLYENVFLSMFLLVGTYSQI